MMIIRGEVNATYNFVWEAYTKLKSKMFWNKHKFLSHFCDENQEIRNKK